MRISCLLSLIIFILAPAKEVFGQLSLANSAFPDLEIKSHDSWQNMLSHFHFSNPARQPPQPHLIHLPAELHAPTALFCRIEDAIAKHSKVNLKFRLGSVDYVNALEGKGYLEAVSYSRATNFLMQYGMKR